MTALSFSGSSLSVHAQFAKIVELMPLDIAIVSESQTLTYRDLDELANSLAHVLIADGVQSGELVALRLERSVLTIATMLAVLKAGAAYLPLDPGHPLEHQLRILGIAKVRRVLTTKSFAATLAGHAVRALVLDLTQTNLDRASRNAPDVAVTGDSLAYVMFTSGSTGEPKGVMVPHRAIDRLVRDPNYVQLGPSHTLLQAAPLAFDASTFEIFGALLTGAKLALHDESIPTAQGLGESIRRFGVTTMWLTAGLFNAIVDELPDSLRGLKQLLVGGEALSVVHITRALRLLPATQLINGYGPTEATTFSACYAIPQDLPADVASIPIGRALNATSLYVLDAQGQPVAVGIEGELYIGGSGVALGYIGRDELTRERFLIDPFAGEPKVMMYRTGDLVRQSTEGVLEYVGRIDQQVKIAGHRIELGEIEASLRRHPAVKDCVVVAPNDGPARSRRLVAYLVLQDVVLQDAVLQDVVLQDVVPQKAVSQEVASQEFALRDTGSDVTAIRDWLRESLPSYMVPSVFVALSSMPLTANGKVDHRALPRAKASGPRDCVRIKDEYEEKICATIAEILELAVIAPDETLLDIGLTSLLIVRAVERLRARHAIHVSPTLFFEYKSVAGIASALRSGGVLLPTAEAGSPTTGETKSAHEDVAIVGMSARYPGADDVEAFWRNLCDGIDSVAHFSREELDNSVDGAVSSDAQYVPARGVLKNVGDFDAAFFGISPREAQLMDPQQRITLEMCWHALEHAALVPEAFAGPVGVFAGVYNNSYASTVLARHPDVVRQYGEFNAMLLNEKDYVATRVAYKLGLTGPAISIHTACSTSLVAICQALQSLRSGECDAAIAGGVSLTIPTNSGHLYQEGSMLSMNGQTRTFDVNASGTVFSDGAGFVVLRRLSDAQRDGHTIYAVLRGAAVNNDGGGKASFTAPSVSGQAAVVARAQRDAGVGADAIQYVEAHGTATPLGDPIEVEALTRAFRASTAAVSFCRLGSVKSNIGHTVIAAGAAGVIKTALALQREYLPASLHFDAPNPKIDFAQSPFVVAGDGMRWPRADVPRIAGVSAFGVGGTNAHVILQEPPAALVRTLSNGPMLLVQSARSDQALGRAGSDLAVALAADNMPHISDVAFTLACGRRAHRHRRAVVAGSSVEAARAFAGQAERATVAGIQRARTPAVVFMFPGQGAQHPGMGSALYSSYRPYRDAFDSCAAIMLACTGVDLVQLLFHEQVSTAAQSLQRTAITQPAMYATEFALASLWRFWGIEPRAMIGHSIGEFTCAALAGVFAPEDGMRLVIKRGQLMQQLPTGRMLSVRLPATEVAARIGKSLCIAADNSPKLCVVAGPDGEIEEFKAALTRDGVVARDLHTSHAFHSSMMDPLLVPFAETVASIQLAAPRIPFVSSVTGNWISDEEARSASYWARHLRSTVQFRSAVTTVLSDYGADALFLEVGPRATLSTFARQAESDVRPIVCVPSLSVEAGDDDRGSVLLAAGKLWCEGASLNVAAVLPDASVGRRVALPAYPFERVRFWLDAAPVSVSTAERAPEPKVHANSPANPPANPPEQSVHAEPTVMQQMQQVESVVDRVPSLVAELRELLESQSGIEFSDTDLDLRFVELGFDSLILTQVALELTRKYATKFTIRQLMEDRNCVNRVAQFLDKTLPKDAVHAPVPALQALQTTPGTAGPQRMPTDSAARANLQTPVVSDAVRLLIEQQLRIMAQQLEVLGGTTQPADVANALVASTPIESSARAATPAQPRSSEVANGRSTDEVEVAPSVGPGREIYDAKKAFGAAPRISVSASSGLAPLQQARLSSFVRRYCARTKLSKAFTESNRSLMADPRVVSGFRPLTKELVYSLVVARSKGSRMWDLDGNEYIDVLSGFGSNLFGWSPDFIVDAIKQQLDVGHEVGPQHPLAAEVSALVRELTGAERVALCNTGSEAVLGAIRIARTVTGRKLIVIFSGSYHGINDEVIVRARKDGRALPAAPGIMPETSQNVLVLEYGAPDALAVIERRANEIAAVIVEPVQSRRPDLQPVEFLRTLRTITEQAQIVYVWDEIVTGFRVAPGGAQEHFGVRADLATYGKVMGGGMPIGVIAGKRTFMDALDGGDWRFGDDSFPEVGVTYFAGTFVRHPLALAAAKATLLRLKREGSALQQRLTERTARLASSLNEVMRQAGAPLEVRHFASVWKTFFTADEPNGDLLFYMLRDRGIHIYDGFPCFMTESHSDEDMARVVSAYKEAIEELQEGRFITDIRGGRGLPAASATTSPPVPGARLGRDRDGSPAWFVPSSTDPGGFDKLEAG